MIRALIYLRSVSLYNRVAVTARRLRQPKYFLSFLVGVAYFYLFFFRRMHLAPAAGMSPASIPFASIVTVAGAILLVVLTLKTALSWNAASLEARLKFSDAEVAFLFSAPLSRRRLIHFNLLGSQLMILLSSVVITFVFDRWSFLGGSPLTHAVGWWVILSTFSLYGNAMNFVAARAQQYAGPGLRRRVLMTLAVLALLLVRRLWVTSHPPPDFSNGDVIAGFLTYLARWIEASVGRVVLLPFRLVVAPFAAPTNHEFLLAMGPALIFPAICYTAIILLEVPFREGSVIFAQRRGELTAARRAGSASGVRGAPQLKPRKDPFRLLGTGRPEAAFLWKNLIGIQSWFNWRLVPLLLALGFFLVTTATPHRSHGHSTLAALPGAASSPADYAPVVLIATALVGFYVMLLGPQLIRQDLRSDLLNADLLKVYPLPGWQIVLGQMLTPAIILGGLLGLVALAFGWVEFSGFAPAEAFGFATRAALLACIAVIIPPVVLLQLVIPNAAALLFPAWHQTARTRTGGVEAIGQRLIFTFGQFLMVGIALLPAVVMAALIMWAGAGWGYIINSAAGAEDTGAPNHVIALVLATICVLVIVGAEVWVGLWWLGRRFEMLDIASELKP